MANKILKTIEEKAKAYDEALKKAKDMLSYKEVRQEDIEYLFPELAESEDERIRKWIIDNIQETLDVDGFFEGQKTMAKEAIAWLEKQKPIEPQQDMLPQEQYAKAVDECIYGEQKPTDKVEPKFDDVEEVNFFDDFRKTDSEVEPKFKERDWVIIDGETLYITNVTEDGYSTEEGGYIPFRCEKDARLWTIEDAKDGDVLCSNQLIILFKQWEDNTGYSFVIAHAGIDVSGKLQITNGHWLINNKSKPATKEQRDLLFKKIKEAGYEWDAEKKELKKIEQKPAWSEEDESRITTICTYLQDYARLSGSESRTIRINEYCDWLKSLKDSVLPQPKQEWSEEDEQYLLVCKNALAKYQRTDKWDAIIILRWLENKLKSLRPQSQWKPSDEQITAVNTAINVLGKGTLNGKQLIELQEQLNKLSV